jgi:hypothetical protein
MNHGKAGKRGKVGGWTAASSRRNLKFLWSVRTKDLTGQGWSFTLTVRNCPATPKEWAEWCALYWKRLFECGAIRLHWVIEWQRRGCPHLHGSVYFPDTMTESQVENVLLDGWCYRNPYDPSRLQQRALSIYDANGWNQYVAKHAARGVQHYQRSPENIPAEWKGTTGRMWGKRGLWPIDEPVQLHFDDWRGDGGWYPLRRLMRSYRVAQARSKGDRAAQVHARSMLKANSRELGQVRGISCWIPCDVLELLAQNIHDRGYSVQLANQ